MNKTPMTAAGAERLREELQRRKTVDRPRITAEIIDVRKIDAGGRVVFGATVELCNLATDEEVTYIIVGEDEADIKEGKVSVNSPLARGLIGKSEGDTAPIQAPGGLVEYEILSVSYQ